MSMEDTVPRPLTSSTSSKTRRDTAFAVTRSCRAKRRTSLLFPFTLPFTPDKMRLAFSPASLRANIASIGTSATPSSSGFPTRSQSNTFATNTAPSNRLRSVPTSSTDSLNVSPSQVGFSVFLTTRVFPTASPLHVSSTNGSLLPIKSAFRRSWALNTSTDIAAGSCSADATLTAPSGEQQKSVNSSREIMPGTAVCAAKNARRQCLAMEKKMLKERKKERRNWRERGEITC